MANNLIEKDFRQTLEQVQKQAKSFGEHQDFYLVQNTQPQRR